MKKLLMTLVIPSLITCFFLGVAVGKYQLPPFNTLLRAKKSLEPTYNSGWEMRVSHFSALESRKAAVIMVGDSLTAGAEWNELFPDQKILNRGIGAETSKALFFRINELRKRNPKAIFLLTGTNDLLAGDPVTDVLNRIEDLANDYSQFTDDLYIQSVIQLGSNFTKTNRERVDKLNNKLKSLCFLKGYTFVDLNRALEMEGVLNPEFTGDGIHLNGMGYQLWAETVAPYMVNYE